MAKPFPLGTDPRTLADQYVTDFSLYIKDLCPDADLEISFILVTFAPVRALRG
jgi:hypothetical protein